MEVTPAASEQNRLALISLIVAVATWLIFGIGLCFSFFLPPIAICTAALFLASNGAAAWTGYTARKQIDEGDGAEGGRNLATIGFIMGLVGGVLALLGLVVAIILTVIGGAAILSMPYN